MVNFRKIADTKNLYRSALLKDLTEQDIAILRENNIKTVIDLRTPREYNEEKDDEVEGIKNIHLPLVDDDGLEMEIVIIKGMTLPDMEDYYTQMVSVDLKESWTKLFELLLSNNEPILFHCTSGKDRSGIVSAIILSALGYDDGTIYHDYLLTNENVDDPLPFQEYANTLPPDKAEIFLNHFKAREEYLDSMFGHIREEFGSIKKFLKECCSLDEDKIKILNDKYGNKDTKHYN